METAVIRETPKRDQQLNLLGQATTMPGIISRATTRLRGPGTLREAPVTIGRDRPRIKEIRAVATRRLVRVVGRTRERRMAAPGELRPEAHRPEISPAVPVVIGDPVSKAGGGRAQPRRPRARRQGTLPLGLRRGTRLRPQAGQPQPIRRIVRPRSLRIAHSNKHPNPTAHPEARPMPNQIVQQVIEGERTQPRHSNLTAEREPQLRRTRRRSK
jgi:hypothetical protein